jgi:hypothetical protein
MQAWAVPSTRSLLSECGPGGDRTVVHYITVFTLREHIALVNIFLDLRSAGPLLSVVSNCSDYRTELSSSPCLGARFSFPVIEVNEVTAKTPSRLDR